MYYVYILLCVDNKSYVGGTNNLKARLQRHKKGYVHATKNRLPVNLIAYFAFKNKHIAFSFEQYLKTGSGRAFLQKHMFQNL